MEPELSYPVLVAYAEDHHLVRDALINNLEQTGKVKMIVTADNGADLIKVSVKVIRFPMYACWI